MRLSKHARAALLRLADGPALTAKFNPGIVHKLLGDGLAERVSLPSPYERGVHSHASALRLTDAGRALAQELREAGA